MQITPIVPPFKGVDDQNPLIALEAPFCENMLNFNSTQGGVALRVGDKNYTTFSNPAVSYTSNRLVSYGGTSLWVLTHRTVANTIEIYDADAGTVSFTSASTYANQTFYESYFNKYLYLFSRGTYAPGVAYSGSAWAVVGYTGSGFLPAGGVAFKERHFIIQYNDAAYWYSDILAVTGALTKVDLNSVISEKAVLFSIAPITISDSGGTETLLAFVFSSGETLFYSGSYPDSGSWALKGRASVGSPLGLNTKYSDQGDTFILTDAGIVSLRDLFLKGSIGAIQLSINKPIQKTWSDMVKAIREATGFYAPTSLESIRAVVDKKNNRTTIIFPYFFNASGVLTSGNYQFIFDALRQAWFFHRSHSTNSFCDATYHKNKVLLLSSVVPAGVFQVVEKEGNTTYNDVGVGGTVLGYQYNITSAPVQVARTNVQKILGMDILLKSDLYSETTFNFVMDLGRQNTGGQKIPDQGVEVAKPFLNVGADALTVQYELDGETVGSKTVGLKLYGVNVWSEKGASPR